MLLLEKLLADQYRRVLDVVPCAVFDFMRDPVKIIVSGADYWVVAEPNAPPILSDDSLQLSGQACTRKLSWRSGQLRRITSWEFPIS